MSEGWRRATSPQRSRIDVVLPNAGLSRSADDATILQGHVHVLQHQVEMLSHSRDTLQQERHQAQVDAARANEDARRQLVENIGRERRQMELSKLESTQLQHDCDELKRNLNQANERNQELNQSLDIERRMRDTDTVSLRAENGRLCDENKALRQENLRLVDNTRVLQRDRDSLERLVVELRADLSVNGRTVAEQSDTIRALTTEMSRRDPVDLVRHQRAAANTSTTVATDEEVFDLREGATRMKRQVAILTKERDAARKAVDEMQEELEVLAAKPSAANKSVKMEAEASAAAQQNKINFVEAERDTALQQVNTLKEQLAKTSAALKQKVVEVDQLRENVTSMQSATVDTKTEDLEKHRKQLLTERQRYEQRIVTLQKSVAETQAQLDAAETAAKERKVATKAQINQVKEQVEKDKADLKLQLEASHKKIAKLEKDLNVAQQQAYPSENVAHNVSAAQGQVIQESNTAAPAGKLIDVKFTIKAAYNIADRDGFGRGESDAFVTVLDTTGKERLRTPVVDDAKNPTWPADKASVKLSLVSNSPGFVQFEAWNHNTTKNDFLGCVRLAVMDIFNGGSGIRRYALGPRRKENDEFITENAGKLGDLEINIQIPGVASTQQPPAGAGSRSANQAGAATSDNSLTEDVTVHVMKCNKLLDRDGMGFGESDPYVNVINPLKKEVLRTPVADDNSNPTWTADKASVKLKLVRGSAGLVTFEVWDNNMTKSTFLGAASLSLGEIFKNGSGMRTLALGPREKENDPEILENEGSLGTITVNVKVPNTEPKDQTAVQQPAKPPVQKPSPCEMQAVTFHVAECKELMDRDGMFNDSDPYVCVYGPGQKEGSKALLRTPTIDGTSNPKWAADKGSVKINLAPGSADTVRFEVWDCDDDKSAFLGCYIMSMDEVFNRPDGQRTYKLGPRPKENDPDIKEKADQLGKIILNVSKGQPVVQNAPKPPAQQQQPPQPQQPQQPAAPNQGPPVPVKVQVVECKELMDRDGMFNDSDPYVCVYGPGHKEGGKALLRTPTIDGTSNPKWAADKATVRIPLAVGMPGAISFEVWDCDDDDKKGKSAFLGYASIPVTEAITGTGGPRTYKLTSRPKENDPDIKEKAKSGALGSITVDIQPAPTAAPSTAQQQPPVAAPTAPTNIPTATPGAPAPTPVAPAAPVAPAPPQPKKFKVHVASAAGLYDNDGFGRGESDPMVEVKGGNGKRILSTAEVSDNLNPTWPEEGNSTVVQVAPGDTTSKLTFTVYDVDTSGRDFLGMATLNYSELRAGPKQMKLESDGENLKGKKLGSLTIMISAVQ